MLLTLPWKTRATADGRCLLVMHGDLFDNIVRYHKWLSLLGGWGSRSSGHDQSRAKWYPQAIWQTVLEYGGCIKRRVKHAVDFLSRFEEAVVHEARRRGLDGIVCGHVHQAVIREINGLVYCNTGGWRIAPRWLKMKQAILA